MKNRRYLLLCLLLTIFYVAKGQDSSTPAGKVFRFKGQLSAWGHYNSSNTLPLYLGGRFIPQVDYEKQVPHNRLLAFEASANLYGTAGMHPFDSLHTAGSVKPYRIWGRFSTPYFELRIGLQKINFGSATLFRPLRWFDHVDPRDPLHLTEGVWAILGKYYFPNNANIWLWTLFDNNKPKGWEVLKTKSNIPEFGGRLQLPLPSGAMGFTYHHRTAEADGLVTPSIDNTGIPENRFGLDIRMDVTIGLWAEAAWITKSKPVGILTNREWITLGSDYTLGIGNGLYVLAEHLMASSDEKPFHLAHTMQFTGFTATYPVGTFDKVQTIFYYDWTNQALYGFVNWSLQFNKITFYFMGYWNPKTYLLPLQQGTENLYAGKGIQTMIVYDF